MNEIMHAIARLKKLPVSDKNLRFIHIYTNTLKIKLKSISRGLYNMID